MCRFDQNISVYPYFGLSCKNEPCSVADLGLPRWRNPTPNRGCQPIIWPNFAKKCMKMKRIGPRVGHVAKMLLCRSATAVVNSDCEQFNCMNSIDFTFKYIPVCPLYSLNVNIYILCWIESIVYRVSTLSQLLSQTQTESGAVKIQASKTSQKQNKFPIEAQAAKSH